jgi:hypothetical protein
MVLQHQAKPTLHVSLELQCGVGKRGDAVPRLLGPNGRFLGAETAFFGGRKGVLWGRYRRVCTHEGRTSVFIRLANFVEHG